MSAELISPKGLGLGGVTLREVEVLVELIVEGVAAPATPPAPVEEEEEEEGLEYKSRSEMSWKIM